MLSTFNSQSSTLPAGKNFSENGTFSPSPECISEICKSLSKVSLKYLKGFYFHKLQLTNHNKITTNKSQ